MGKYFEGFPKEYIDFLWELRMNNNTEWFAANRDRYETLIKEPMKLFSAEMTERMNDMGMGESQGNRFICKGLEHRKYLTFLYTGIDKKGLILSFHQIHGASHLVVNGP